MDNQKQEEPGKEEKPLHELLTSSLVDINVGPDSTHWTLHEELLTHHSPFFKSIFNGDDEKEEKARANKSYSLPDEDDKPFELLVGWLYSSSIRPPKDEKDIGPLLELYLLSERLEIKKLSLEIVDGVREFYHATSSYPGLRRVQYIYSETDEDNEMREMMVSAIARQLTTGDKIPVHWASALKRNGQLAVDIIRAIQQWNIEERSIPDIRDGSQHRGRQAKGGLFSAVERVAESHETLDTTDTNLGVESINSEQSDAPIIKSEGDEEFSRDPSPRPPSPRIDPPDKQEPVASEAEAEEEEEEGTSQTETKADEVTKTDTEGEQATETKSALWKALSDAWRFSRVNRIESTLLLSAWLVYVIYYVGYAFGKETMWS